MVRPVGIIVVRAFGLAQSDKSPVFPVTAICEEIEFRFDLSLYLVRAVEQAVEEFRHGLGGRGLEGEDSLGKAGIAVQSRVLD